MAREIAAKLFTGMRPEVLAPLVSAIVIVIMMAVGDTLAPGFVSLRHTLLLLELSGFLGIVAIGETVVILTGGIDLSIPWVITGAGVVFTGVTMGQSDRLLLGLVAALGLGAVAGLMNGLGVAKLKASPVIMTLAMNNVMEGVTMVYSQGTPEGGSPQAIVTLATGHSGIMPNIVMFWAGLAVIVTLVLGFTRGGRLIYGFGANRVVSRLSGVRDNWVIITAYTVSGLTAALGGILYCGFSGSSFLGMGDSFLLPAIAAVVLGGASIFGGSGTYIGSLIGVFFLTVLSSVLSITNISAGVRHVIYGLVIALAVILHQTYSKRQA